MFSFFTVKAEDFPSYPREYIHKRDEREETIPIFKYSQPSQPVQTEEIKMPTAYPDASECIKTNKGNTK